MENLHVAQTFVLHVKQGYEERRQSIESQLARHGIDFEYMLDGDIPDLTAADLARFTGWLALPEVRAGLSCTLKHLKIYEQMVARALPNALILEDDIFLAPDFVPVVNATLREVHERDDIDAERVFISYENSSLRFIPRSRQRRGQKLYAVDKTRGTGAYYITLPLARLMLAQVAAQPLADTIDLFHTKLCQAGLLPVFWCQPTVAEQGSMNGTFGSTISRHKATGFVRRLQWSFDKAWKRFVYAVK